jgi:hypothetical protein
MGMVEDAVPRSLDLLDEAAKRRSYTLERLDQQIRWYETSARRNNWGLKVCKIAAVTIAASVAVFSAAAAPPLTVAALGALIVVAQGVQEVFQFQAFWINSGRTKELLKRERALYFAGAGPYARTDDPDRLLAERTEAVAGVELDTWVQSQQGQHED